ncbi:MAG: ABC transporter ATP-binding protein [Bradyrhizobium sp.]|nr:ABC transporter ATP-binding protein [Bradyrhizobium sp.]MDO8400113.1 ABC transporter ATP-binding protein [Bradyrhizobium sp.]
MTGGYGAVDILHSCTIAVEKGQIAVIVGPNGAGKSTAMKAVFGMLNLRGGAVKLQGEDITKLTPQARVRKGMGFVPQTHNIFTTMTVEENLQLGAITRKDKAAVTSDIERMYDHFPVLKERHTQQAGTLSGGEQQMLAVARALMLRPRLMLLDEPSFGLAPLIVRDLFKILGKINREDKVTILVVEQNAQLALELADKAYVIETGRIVMSGSASEIANNEDVRKSYLGY